MTVLLIVANVAVYFIVVSSTQSAETVTTTGSPVRLPGRTAFDLEHAAIPCELTERRPLDIDEVIATYNGGHTNSCLRDAAEAAASPELFPDKQIALSILVSMFLHGGLAHLGFNMLFLWVFGNNIEDRLGPILFLAFYLVGGLAATLAHVLVGPSSTVPVIGASGAIAAVMGAYLCWYPRPGDHLRPADLRFPLRAQWLLIAWFVLQFFTQASSGVAWVAHVGGFLFGVTVGLLGRPRGQRTARPSYG